MNKENNGEGVGFVEADITTWSEPDYRRLLAEIEPLFLATEGTPASERADLLFDRIEAYEQNHYQIADWLRAIPGTVKTLDRTQVPSEQKQHQEKRGGKVTEVSDLMAV